MKTNKLIYSLLLALFFPMALLAKNRLIINQVMYDTPLTEVENEKGAYNGEFIELYNAGAEDIELEEWGILSLSGKKHKEVSQFNNVIIPSGGYYVFAIRRGNDNTFELKDLYTSLQNQNPAIEYQNKIILANAKETLYLLHNNDTIDQIICGSDTQLKAKNASNISGNDCVSLHRIGVEFDENGKAIPNKSQWKTDKVSFSECQLPKRIYEDRTIISFDPSSTGTTSTANGNNYILTITPLDEVDTINVTKDGISIDGNVRANTAIQYYDGLGRPNELVAIGVTPRKRDLVSTTTYNGLHRATEQYLPIPMASEGQFTNVASVQDQAKSYFGDNRPFTETLYENSALDRVIGEKRPGQSYADYPATSKFEVNTETDIRIYTVIDGSLKPRDCYPAYSLFRTTTMDEDGKGSVITYADKLGRKIMEERSGSRTYFVYDDLNRLCFVLPNLPKTRFTSGEYDKERLPLKNIAYCYEYDSRGNMIYKRLPGCEHQYMVYDVAGQLVLKQDGNQRAKSKWTLFSYDSIGRNSYTAEVDLQADWRGLVDQFANEWQVGDKALSVLGTNKSALRMLTENFYDNYEFPEADELKYASGYDAPYNNATGLLTGTRVRNLEENGYTTTVYYYDGKGRIVQTHSRRSQDGYEMITSSKYNFDGSVAEAMTTQGTGADKVTEHYAYSYDHAGRLLVTKYQLNDDPEFTLSKVSYDEQGRLVRNLLHNQTDTIDYSYDMRNMLTETKNKHFSEQLFYADNVPQYGVQCFNGNIAATRVNYADQGGGTFYHKYDEQNRLYSSCQDPKYGLRYGGMGETFSYDDAGNIISLKRQSRSKLIDDLTFYYDEDGTRLLEVSDNGSDEDNSTTIEYKDFHKDGTEMIYDANGNLVKDIDRGIEEIVYNILNLPDTIFFSNGNVIVNYYDAAGQKYKYEAYTYVGSAIITSPEDARYAFNPEENDYGRHTISYYGNVEHHLLARNTSARPGLRMDAKVTTIVRNAIGYSEEYKRSSRGRCYYHYIKDHLGSNCAVIVSGTGMVEQSIKYFASGVPMTISNMEDQQLYNGKEFIHDHEYNEYDSQARMYYATIMRTTTMDPHAENNYHQSPYSWCSNNPVNRIDPNGMDDEFDKEGRYIRHVDNGTDYVMVENANGEMQNLTEFSYGENDAANRAMVSNVITHYAHQVGLNQTLDVCDVEREGGQALTDIDSDFHQVYIAIVNGRIDSDANTANNIMNSLEHEKDHVEKGTRGSMAEVCAIQRQVNHSTWSKTTESYQIGVMKYLIDNANRAIEHRQSPSMIGNIVNSLNPYLPSPIWFYNNQFTFGVQEVETIGHKRK